ncbi:MAG: GtrA family protein [Steroidobacteraceae bacterium]
MSAHMREFLIDLLGYGLVSAIALGIDISILHALVYLAGWHYLVASAVAFVCGSGVAYLLSVRFVFRFRQVDNGALEFGYFFGLGAAGLAVNAATLFICISAAGLTLFAAKLVAAGCTFGTNFALRRQLLFTPARSY